MKKHLLRQVGGVFTGKGTGAEKPVVGREVVFVKHSERLRVIDRAPHELVFVDWCGRGLEICGEGKTHWLLLDSSSTTEAGFAIPRHPERTEHAVPDMALLIGRESVSRFCEQRRFALAAERLDSGRGLHHRTAAYDAFGLEARDARAGAGREPLYRAPQVAVSGDNVYVLWFDWLTNELILRVSHDAGATFGSALVVGNAAPDPSLSGMNAVSPRLAAVGSDVFIVWSSYVGVKTDIFFNRSTDAGGAFAGPVKLSGNLSGTPADFDPQLALAEGRLYVAWQERLPTGDTSSVNHLFIRTSADDGASFSPAQDLRPQWPASSPLAYGTLKVFRLAASGADVYVAWMGGPLVVSGGGDPDNGQELILLSASHDHGATFAAPARVNAAQETNLQDVPQIAGSGNNVYVAWSQQFPIGSTGYFSAEERLRRSTDGGASFGEAIPLATSGSCDTYPSFQTLPLIAAADGARVLWKGRNCARTSLMDKDIFLRAVHESVSANEPPEVDAGAGQTVAAGDIVTLAGTATDPDGDPLLVSWSQTGGPPVALGTTDRLALDFSAPEADAPVTLTFELTAHDGLASSAATVSVTVNPRAPITDFAEANPELWELMVDSWFPPPLWLGSTTVDVTPPVVTGTPDRGPDANGWYNHGVTITWSGEDDSGPVSCDPPTVYGGPAGDAIVIEGECTDAAGNVGTGSVTLKYDSTPPTLVCTVTPTVLWPPNHKLVTVTVTIAVEDGASGRNNFTLLSVTSSEPDNGLGDGDRPNDIGGWDVGTGDTSGEVRAERSGSGGGRVYMLTYEGSDAAGNTATCTATVSVPSEMGP